MKKLMVLLVVPFFAGCFAWDMDDKPLPWMDDPVDRPSIGKVVYYPDDPEPRPIPRDKDFRAYYEEGLHPEWWTPNRAPVQQGPQMREIPSAPARPPALAEGDLEGEIPCEVIEQSPAPKQPQAAPADGKLEKRIEALESRIEQLFQELLKAYGDKK